MMKITYNTPIEFENYCDWTLKIYEKTKKQKKFIWKESLLLLLLNKNP